MSSGTLRAEVTLTNLRTGTVLFTETVWRAGIEQLVSLPRVVMWFNPRDRDEAVAAGAGPQCRIEVRAARANHNRVYATVSYSCVSDEQFEASFDLPDDDGSGTVRVCCKFTS